MFACTSHSLHTFTLPELRAATQAGGVTNVILKAQGNAFYVQIHTRTTQIAVLVTAKTRQPRQFRNPLQAFNVLRDIGIMVGSFELIHYSPEQQQTQFYPDVELPSLSATAASSCWNSGVQATLDDPNLQLSVDETERLRLRQKNRKRVE